MENDKVVFWDTVYIINPSCIEVFVSCSCTIDRLWLILSFSLTSFYFMVSCVEQFV